MTITGLHINYYFICKRKLWLSLNYVNLEFLSDDVYIGFYIEQDTYKKRADKNKQVLIGDIMVDYIDTKNKVLHETKKTSKKLNSAIWQMKYYLYTLGDGYTGCIDIPKERKIVDVTITEEDKISIKNIIIDINNISKEVCPPNINSKICFKCSYNNFCNS